MASNRHHYRHLALLGAAACILSVPACQSRPLVGTAPPEPAAAPRNAVVADAVPVAAETETTSPVSQRSRDRAAAWADAVRGLDFESGFVEVDPELVRNDPAMVSRHMVEGEQARDTNHRTAAVKAFARAVLAAPDQTAPYMALGDAMIMKGKIDLAMASYRTVVRMDPSNVEARVALAESLAREQRRDEAIAEMDAAVALDPDHGKAHERLAIWNYYEGDHATSWRHVHAARAANETMPPQFLVLLESKMADPGADPGR